MFISYSIPLAIGIHIITAPSVILWVFYDLSPYIVNKIEPSPFCPKVSNYESLSEDYPETFKIVALRAWRVYIFVMALIFLGAGFKPLIDNLISKMPGETLYWVNVTSAVLDNATLAAAELGPHMNVGQIKGILMGIVISGGILIPGNIPNIISASKLRISSRSWAVIGLPVGFSLMGLYYVVLYIL